MAIYQVTDTGLSETESTSFADAGFRERDHIQQLLKRQIDVIAPDTLIISEEFGDWENSRRRIDLLGLDKEGNPVVIELKRTQDGGRELKGSVTTENIDDSHLSPTPLSLYGASRGIC